jgi:predicted nucleic acid-binding protein
VILADTSAWIEYDRATGSAVHRRMRQLIAEEKPLATTQPVVMEVLAGARDARRERDLRRLLSRFTLLRFEAAVDFDGAARVYRQCRARSVTPRGLVDCMVVTVAARLGAALLAHDTDFSRIARVLTVELDGATTR